MDLHSGLAFWLVKNKMYDYFHPLDKKHKTEIAIIGSGITGSLVAHELCKAGIKVSVFDKRTISTGSTVASTAQLQYEIDVPLCKMVDIVEESVAVKAYHASLASINDIGKVLKDAKVDADYKNVSSVWLASYKKDLKLLEKEYAIREKYSLPVSYLEEKDLKKQHHIDAPGALKNNEAAQMDAYAAATGLLQHHLAKSELELFTHTRIVKWQEVKNGYELQTENGHTIQCKYVVIAAGFEAGQFLPKEVMQLQSTYALISKPVHEKELWPERSLIWETKEPYFYMRTTADNRMMIGGEDEEFKDPIKRDDLLREKIRKLEKQFHKTYPDIPFETEMAWCGTFSSTKDGLPYIGTWPRKKRMFFALGYGGNGITFSMIAAQVIRNILQGKKDERADVFSFERKRKK
ncbi:NAD(P)/FAD-dependent oxidoreductase [Rhizosphaericola mali]|uniref:FAD-binding oxidoreductase n=1 Tax=Rhizosphaericola mali TaxID=2545455 RepID=A0A5P2FY48_9BACT|nr:FAD-dependent oxidoreductase [Rhizosphaericola mali]QES88115.1 FAD-binding oxidoreductase [Rhizosphaericola mali]